MKKFKRKLRGVTLVEIIISLAIFAMLSLVLCLMGSAVEKNTRAAKNLNSRVAVEGPIAEAQNAGDSYLVNNNFQIKVGKGENGSFENGHYVNIEGTLYYVNQELGTNATGTDDKGGIYVIPDSTVDAQIAASRNAEVDPEQKYKYDFNYKYVAIAKPTGTMVPLITTTTTN